MTLNVENGERPQPDSGEEAEQKRLAIQGLFRLLETSIQTTQFKVAGKIVVPAQEIVGVIMSAKSGFDAGKIETATQELNQAAENFRYKAVRWETEARTAQAGRSNLTDAQKRHLPAEISEVRTASRKTQLFFERLLTALGDWVRTVGAGEGQPDEKAAVSKESDTHKSLQQVQVAYVPTDEVTRRVSASVRDLTMLVRQQFEELDKLFQGTQYRQVQQPVQNAWDVFSEGHYSTAKFRLSEAHQVFLQLLSTSKFPRANTAEEHFKTLLHGLSQIEQAAKDKHEDVVSPDGIEFEVEVERASDAAEDLDRLRQILEDDLDEMFPPGTSPEERNSAEEHLQLCVSGPVARLSENIQALRHAIISGANNDAPQTIEARTIIKRLLKRAPQEIRPTPGAEAQVGAFHDMDEDGITLDFSLFVTRMFPVDVVDLRQASKLELIFCNPSSEPVRLHVQMYNAAEQPMLSKPEALQLRSTHGEFIKGHLDVAGLSQKIDPRIGDAQVVKVEFTNMSDDVDIADVAVIGPV